MKKFLSAAFWRKGGGEIIGFVYILPFIVMLICCIIAAAQVSLTKQTLTYTAYNACRAAVVSVDETTAVERSKAVYESSIGTVADISQLGGAVYEPIEIEVLDGGQWEKGNFVRCTVRLYIDTLLPFTSGIREETIVMMIENAAPGSFEHLDGAG